MLCTWGSSQLDQYACIIFVAVIVEDMPVDSCKQHTVVVYIDSGNYTEALLRSELADVEVLMESHKVVATANSWC